MEMERKVMKMFARMRPKRMVMALPMTGRKAKKPIHAPLPFMKRPALSKDALLTWR